MIKKICLYARVSTDLQATGLESQARALREYCRMNNINEAELFTDENQSGAKASRPALDRMMSMVRNKEVEKVICYSLSRLGRSTTHLLKLMDEMNNHDVKFISLSERLETETPAGRMIFTLTGESIPAKNLEGKISFGLTLDPSYFGSTRLEVPDECES